MRDGRGGAGFLKGTGKTGGRGGQLTLFAETKRNLRENDDGWLWKEWIND